MKLRDLSVIVAITIRCLDIRSILVTLVISPNEILTAKGTGDFCPRSVLYRGGGATKRRETYFILDGTCILSSSSQISGKPDVYVRGP